MKLLFDQNLSFRLAERLGDIFADSGQVKEFGMERTSDAAIWQYAKLNGFTVVTQDSDFAEMAALYGPPPKVVWLRWGNQTTSYVERNLRAHADVIVAFGNDSNAACIELI